MALFAITIGMPEHFLVWRHDGLFGAEKQHNYLNLWFGQGLCWLNRIWRATGQKVKHNGKLCVSPASFLKFSEPAKFMHTVSGQETPRQSVWNMLESMISSNHAIGHVSPKRNRRQWRASERLVAFGGMTVPWRAFWHKKTTQYLKIWFKQGLSWLKRALSLRTPQRPRRQS